MADERVVTTEDVDPREYAQLLAQGMSPADLPPQQSESSVIQEQRNQMAAERDALRQERGGTVPVSNPFIKKGEEYLSKYEQAAEAERTAREDFSAKMRPEYEAEIQRLEQQQLPQRPALPTFPQVPNRGQYVDQTAAKSLFAVASLMGGLAMAGGRGRGMLAMAGLTGAMQGFREGNMEKYKAGKEEYDRQVEQQLAQYKMLHQEYIDQMTEQHLTLEQKMQRIQLIAKMNEDKVTDAAAEKNDYATIFKQIDELGKMTNEMQKASQADVLGPLKLQMAQIGLQKAGIELQESMIRLKELLNPALKPADARTAANELAQRLQAQLKQLDKDIPESKSWFQDTPETQTLRKEKARIQQELNGALAKLASLSGAATPTPTPEPTPKPGASPKRYKYDAQGNLVAQ